MHKTSSKYKICQYSTLVGTWYEFYLQITYFQILHPKVLSKHKIKNSSILYIKMEKNMSKIIE